MAQATVSLKVNANEIQVINEALRMLNYVCRHTDRPSLEGYVIDVAIADRDLRKLAMLTANLRHSIGLK